ncbi:MAG TPA: oligosaccharide flippase family protein [Candidatus Baltobacteraceae bacterium]|nr:oligosaccharide flippase family protein [Candidatus Baltobacteraceae bacterium]
MTTERIGSWIAATSPNFLEPLWLRFRASPLSVRLARGVFWSFVGAVIARGLGVVSSIIVARMLGINAFGEFTMIQSTVGLFGTFAGLGLGITATKYVAELRELHPVRCGRVVGLILTVAAAGGLIAGAALVLFAPWVATYTLAAPKLAPLLRAGSLLVLFSTLQGVYSGALGGFEAFKRVAHVNWVGAILGTPLLVVCAYTGRLEGAVWGNVVQIALGCAIGHWALAQEAGKRGVKLCYALDLRDFSILWRFSLPAFLSSTLVGPVNWICSTFLAHQKEGFREVALMNAAGQWRNFLIFLPATMTGVLVPMFSSLYHAGNRAEFEKLLRRNMVINVGTALVLSVPISLLATVILDWYGPGFRRGVPVFLLAVFGTAVTAAANLFSRAMQATGRAWMEMAFNALWATALILGCFLLVPTYKAVGLATSHVLAAFALVIWQWLLVRRLLSKASAASIELRGSEPARSG